MKNLCTPEDLANKAQEISNNLRQFTGTSAYYRYSPLFPFMLLTDGTKYLSDECQCYWFLDIIASMQLDPLIRDHQELQTMQFWNLTVNADRSATVTCEWDRHQTVYTQTIGYTDFPLNEVRIWVQPHYPFPGTKEKQLVAHLPSEY